MRAIDAIPDDRFRDLQAAGHAYATAYLRPVMEPRLQLFLEA